MVHGLDASHGDRNDTERLMNRGIRWISKWRLIGKEHVMTNQWKVTGGFKIFQDITSLCMYLINSFPFMNGSGEHA